MNKLLFGVVVVLAALLCWRECTRQDAIQQAIQTTSDEMGDRCDAQIQEFLSQF